jgi:hypothetical protein
MNTWLKKLIIFKHSTLLLDGLATIQRLSIGLKAEKNKSIHLS